MYMQVLKNWLERELMNPLPNHCMECDTPTMYILCDECKDEEVSNCCTAPFTYPGWPDSDVCSKCKEHADIWKEKDG